jgi:hypothetical protein
MAATAGKADRAFVAIIDGKYVRFDEGEEVPANVAKLAGPYVQSAELEAQALTMVSSEPVRRYERGGKRES